MRFKDYVSDPTLELKLYDYITKNTAKNSRYLMVQSNNLDDGCLNYEYVDKWLTEHYDCEGSYKETKRFSTIRSVCCNYSGFEASVSYYPIFKDIFKTGFPGGYNKPLTIYLSCSMEFINFLLTFVNCVEVIHSGEDYIHLKINHSSDTYAEYIFNKNLTYVELVKLAILYMEPDTKPEVLKGLEDIINDFFLIGPNFNMDNVLNRNLEQQIKRINDNIIGSQNNIDYYISCYNKELQRAAKLEKSKTSLKDSIIEQGKIIKKYIDKKVITNITTYSDRIVYTLKTPIFNYSELSIKRRINNYDDSPFKTFLQDVFCSDEYSLLVSTDVFISNDDNGVYTPSRYSAMTVSYIKSRSISRNNRYMPNPHIAGYNCFGTNGPQLTKLLNANKWEEFMQCLIATTGNLNFNDSVVTGTFFNILHHLIDNNDDFFKCIIDKDGNELTVKEYLERKEAANNETATTI